MNASHFDHLPVNVYHNILAKHLTKVVRDILAGLLQCSIRAPSAHE